MAKKVSNPSSEQVSNAADKQIEFASFILEHNFSLIQHVETKANMVLGIVGIMLSILLGLFPNLKGSSLLAIMFSALIVSCVTAGIFAIETIRARVKIDEPDNHLYFLHIVKMKRQEYLNSFKAMSDDKISDNMLNEIYTLAMIQNTKYKLINRAIVFLYITFILLGLNAIAYVYWN